MSQTLTPEEQQIRTALRVAANHLDDPRLREALDRLTALTKLCHAEDMEQHNQTFASYTGYNQIDAGSFYAPYVPLQIQGVPPVNIQQLSQQATANSIRFNTRYNVSCFEPPESDEDE